MTRDSDCDPASMRRHDDRLTVMVIRLAPVIAEM